MYNHREIAPPESTRFRNTEFVNGKIPMIPLIFLFAVLFVTAALRGYNSTIPFYHTGDDTAVS